MCAISPHQAQCNLVVHLLQDIFKQSPSGISYLRKTFENIEKPVNLQLTSTYFHETVISGGLKNSANELGWAGMLRISKETWQLPYTHFWFRIVLSNWKSLSNRKSWWKINCYHCTGFFFCRKCMCLLKKKKQILLLGMNSFSCPPQVYSSAWIRSRNDHMCYCLFNGHNSDTSFTWGLIVLWTRYKISLCSYMHIILSYHLPVDAFLRILSTFFKESVVISVFSTILERAVKENLLSLSPSGKIRRVEN